MTPLTFRQVNSNGNIRISFARRYHGDRAPFDGRGGTLAHTLLPEPSFPMALIHFDDDEFWTINDRRGKYNFNILIIPVGSPGTYDMTR